MSSRRPTTYEQLYAVSPYLTDRDREIVRDLGRFKVFTAEQLAAMYFDTLKRAQVRLHRLQRLGVLDRFQPYRDGWGSSPYHYVLGPLGAEMLAAEADERSHQRGKRPSAIGLALGRPRDLARLRAVNGFYAGLVGHARRHVDAHLLDWMTSAEAAEWSHGMVKPDAFGEWAEGGRSDEFYLVIDRAKSVEPIATDLLSYEQFDSERGATAWVLVLCRDPDRERRLWALLAGSSRRVATTPALGPGGPQGARWATSGGVFRLGGLPSRHPSQRGTDSPRAWLYERHSQRRGGMASAP